MARPDLPRLRNIIDNEMIDILSSGAYTSRNQLMEAAANRAIVADRLDKIIARLQARAS